MDPRLELEQLLTRRHFLGRASGRARGNRPGVAAPARSRGRRARPRVGSPDRRRDRGFPQLRAAGQAGDLPVPVGRAVADGSVRPQARARATPGHRAARLDPDGPAADGHDLAAGPFPGRGQPVRVRPARPERRGVVSELLPHTARVADELCFIKSMHTEAINHDPAVTFFQTGAQLAGRPSIGVLGLLRPGEREPGPAGLRGHDLAGLRQPQRPAALRPALGQRLSADDVPGDQVPLGRRPGALPLQSPRASRPRPGGGRSTTWASSTRSITASSATRRSSRGSPSTRWPSGCRPRSPS